MTASLDHVERHVKTWLESSSRPFVLGLCGAQGSGKTTLAEGLANRLEADGLHVAVLSLDDLYLPRDRRPVHVSPLFATRGVPGTHDVEKGIAILTGLRTGVPMQLPRFDKANDEPVMAHLWPEARALDVMIFEGWCVGAKPQSFSDLNSPVNALEREQDRDGAWRSYVNTQLQGRYADLFARIDRLVLLAAPGFDVVTKWRTEQEHTLLDRLLKEGRAGTHLMSDADIGRFVQYYQRLTEHILRTMPAYADLTISLDASRNMKSNPIY